MRAGFEGLHQLFEALALHPAEQRVGRQAEVVEGDLVFLHAAIAEHFDFAARHALGRERIGVGAARLLGQKHRKASVTALIGIGADEERHQVGANGMGDPGLGPADDIVIAVPGRAGAQGREVGAGVGLGEDRGRQDLAARNLGQVFPFLPVRAADNDEFGGDLGPGAQRADADIAA